MINTDNNVEMPRSARGISVADKGLACGICIVDTVGCSRNSNFLPDTELPRQKIVILHYSGDRLLDCFPENIILLLEWSNSAILSNISAISGSSQAEIYVRANELLPDITILTRNGASSPFWAENNI